MLCATKDFYSATRDARKIIVVDLGFLGDTVHLIPALWEIKRHYPEASLHLLSTPLGSDVCRLASCVDRLWPVELAPGKRSLRQQFSIIRALRRERFDVAFNLGGNDRSIILTALTGARWRVAHQGGRFHFWNKWLIPHWVSRQSENLPVLEQRRQVLAACGFTLEAPRFDLSFETNDSGWAEVNVAAGSIHFSLNSANPLKEWPIAHYVSLARKLWQTQPSLRLVVSATSKAREQARLQEFISTLADARLQALPSVMSIGQLATALKRCVLHFGPDSGVVHLALALGVPTVSLFRDQPGFEGWLPRDSRHHYFLASCRCVDHRHSGCEPFAQAACLTAISPDSVAVQIQTLLARENLRH